MDRRAGGAWLCIGGAVLLVVSLFTNMWWEHSEHGLKVGVGTRAIEVCHDRSSDDDDDDDDQAEGPRCETASLTKMFASAEDPPKRWITFGGITYFGGLIAAALLVVAGGLALAKVTVGGPVSPARLAIAMSGVTVIAGVAFVALLPSEAKDLGMGAGFPLALAGAIGGTIGSVLLAAAPSVTAYAMPTPAVALPTAHVVQASSTGPSPACTRCDAPTRWVAEHNRWFCEHCRIYL